jgi:hypothetical protein
MKETTRQDASLSFPLDAIGVARLRTFNNVKYPDGTVGDAEEAKPALREVVGLLLEEGEFHIVNEDVNFGGLIRKGEKATKATMYLSQEYLDRLPAEVKKDIGWE